MLLLPIHSESKFSFTNGRAVVREADFRTSYGATLAAPAFNSSILAFKIRHSGGRLAVFFSHDGGRTYKGARETVEVTDAIEL